MNRAMIGYHDIRLAHMEVERMTSHATNVVLDPVPRSRRARPATVRTRPSRADIILDALPSVLLNSGPTTRSDPANREPTAEEIRVRAYELYLARGSRNGHHVEDWLQAERELRARTA
jgi:hypothetical protein